MKIKQYKDEKYCPHCDKYTIHLREDSDHERDSSGDWFQCLTCLWSGTGYSDDYYPPYTDDTLDE